MEKLPTTLKVIRGNLGSPSVVRRFEHEAEVLARLQHPGIAQVYEAGSVEVRGFAQPFIAMELVEGVPMARSRSKSSGTSYPGASPRSTKTTRLSRVVWLPSTR
jgi:serine/threonine protein kinase